MVKTNVKLRENTEKVLKEKEIKAEVVRIKKMFKEMSKEKLKIIEGLINEAAFMKITLEGIRQELLEEGTTEWFQQGAQKFKRQHPSVDTYTTLISKYSTVMNQLLNQLPEEEKKNEVDALMNFVQKGIQN